MKLTEQAQKALYALYSKTRNLNIPIDLQFKLFYSLIEPIYCISSEVWDLKILISLKGCIYNF
jgi:hypothetical protein